MGAVIDFDKVAEEGSQSFQETFEIAPERLDADEVAGPVRVRVDVEARTGVVDGEYEVDGELEVRGALRCARCLEDVPFEETRTFEVRYAPRPESESGQEEEVELYEDQLDVDYFSEPRVALEDLAVEQVALALPMKPLCSEECKGLCSSCGASLNSTECDCDASEVDARWEALKDLRTSLEAKEARKE